MWPWFLNWLSVRITTLTNYANPTCLQFSPKQKPVCLAVSPSSRRLSRDCTEEREVNQRKLRNAANCTLMRSSYPYQYACCRTENTPVNGNAPGWTVKLHIHWQRRVSVMHKSTKSWILNQRYTSQRSDVSFSTCSLVQHFRQRHPALPFAQACEPGRGGSQPGNVPVLHVDSSFAGLRIWNRCLFRSRIVSMLNGASNAALFFRSKASFGFWIREFFSVNKICKTGLLRFWKVLCHFLDHGPVFQNQHMPSFRHF